MIKILFICHGNICRSPLAHLYFQDLVKKQGLGQVFMVDSAATSYEEIGNPVHPGTRRKLQEAGISCAGKTARHMEKEDYREFDYLIGMDQANIRNMMRIVGGDPEKKIYKMMEFAKGAPSQNVSAQDMLGQNAPNLNTFSRNPLGHEARDVADPWYTGDFEATWRDVTEGCNGLLEFLRKKHQI